MSPREILEQVAHGELGVEAAMEQLLPSADLGFAVVDHQRDQRCGFPEVVFCEGKEPEQAAEIAGEILVRSPRVLLTRVACAHVEAVTRRFPEAIHVEVAKTLTIDHEPRPRTGMVAVVSAGTSDLPVATEAEVTLSILGAAVEMYVDVGVAGLHRLLQTLPGIRRARAVVAVAGMEGALPSVLAGLLRCPVIAVPTSVGYGASFEGLAALLTMINSCAPGVAVVNIDNGFGGGYLAAMINGSHQDAAGPR